MKLQDLDGEDLSDQEADEHLLFMVWAYCDHVDKSTEYMFAMMMDATDLSYDEVVDFVVSTSDEKRQEWYKTFPTWLEDLKEIVRT